MYKIHKMCWFDEVEAEYEALKGDKNGIQRISQRVKGIRSNI